MKLLNKFMPLFNIGTDLSSMLDHTYIAYFAICNDCGKTWNVSRYKKVTKRGYICPYCTSERQRERKYRYVKRSVGELHK
ncbi:hypothetical protein EHE19_019255 [Ruminiclostridium herbifermentans]|uniref:Uncharacterized protein n=1 Tax=Ruminiclostridium herbifermentans TaxID=2488810 RepID=A0A7H1VNH1_9FIRM|nr:hypothetical protein [Ruminiclostridium herbifermentans]QNU66933.1 hypothetical protein EHE19_019255 [Ruminiclostridium herbifermentans]